MRVGSQRDAVSLEQGDLIIITAGAEHTLFCDPSTENQAVQLDQVVQDSGFDGRGTLIYGDYGTNHETQLVCGHFAFDRNATHPLIDALPPYIHIRDYGAGTGSWMENTLKVIGAEACRDEMGSDIIGLKMSEIIFAQALRTYLSTTGSELPVLAGFADPSISRVLQAIHLNPGSAWTLNDLARMAGMSRTSFANRFSECMSMTPLHYITHWRMQIARQRLAETTDPIIDVAQHVGYGSEAAFGRMFKKQFDIAPATYRRMEKSTSLST